jgi:hypothetical protein
MVMLKQHTAARHFKCGKKTDHKHTDIWDTVCNVIITHRQRWGETFNSTTAMWPTARFWTTLKADVTTKFTIQRNVCYTSDCQLQLLYSWWWARTSPETCRAAFPKLFSNEDHFYQSECSTDHPTLVPFESKLFEILNYSVWYVIHVNFFVFTNVQSKRTTRAEPEDHL